MRVLVVSAQPPLAEGGAAGRCVAAMLHGLHELGGAELELTSIAPRQLFTVASSAPASVPVELIDVPPPSHPMHERWRNLVRPAGELARGQFAERVRQAAAGADVVHLEQVEAAALAGMLGDVPTVTHLHYRARLDAPLGPPWRPDFRQRLSFTRAERRAARTSTSLVANSDDVAASLRRIGSGVSVDVVPLALDTDDYAVADHGGPPTVGIIGTAGWRPTADAIDRLVADVWPSVMRLCPAARLLIAGRGTSALRDRWSGPGVTVVGEVESAGEFLAGLSALVYPPRRGSGTKVKVLEALACGVPAVATRSGAHGLGDNDGLITVDDPAAIAAEVARLLTDVDERRRRGAAARAYVSEGHAPQVVAAQLMEIYRRVRR